MPFRSMEQGISAVQAGNLEEGARLLRIALKDTALTGQLRAVALMWLAETSPDPQHKLTCYKEALAADPGNQDVNQRMALLLSTQLPKEHAPAPQSAPQSAPQAQAAPPPPASNPPPPATIPGMPPSQPQPQQPAAYTPMAAQQPQQPPGTQYSGGAFFRTVGVVGGPNGTGTAFFVAHTGLLATSRYVVGGVEQLTIALDTGRSVPGRVVRAYPELDLAFVQVDIQVSNLLPVAPQFYLPDDARLTAVAHNGKVMSGQRRATKRELAAHWIPTTINRLEDAGGDPLFDERNYLVGMLTHNLSRSSGYFYGLQITSILKALEAYSQEMAQDNQRAYCPCCGYASRAPGVRLFYCEVCGGTLPYAQQVTRFPVPQAANFYGDNTQRECPHCGSRIGYYNGACLRCGGEIKAR